jgi:thiamine-monophosphate kinase
MERKQDAIAPVRRCDISGAEPTADATLGSIGEFGLIARVTSGAPRTPEVLLGPGDDAAVVATPDGRVVATTDLLVEGRHFRRDWSSAYDVGRRAAAANLADIAAMGARPTALLVGFAAPPDLPVEWADGLVNGLREELAVVGAVIVGGDVVRADVVTIAITALGDLDGRDPVTRSGARPGDWVGVVGRLGWAAAGLRLLRADALDGTLQDALRRPEPPYAAGAALAAGGATAMIDVSDGLTADLGHVADASAVRIDLDLAALRTLGTDGVTDDELLTGGDDHALAFTMPASVPASVLPIAGTVVAGTVSEGSGVYVDGKPVRGGHDHFLG